MSLFNQSSVTNFLLDIPDGYLTEALTLNCQAATLPGMRIPVTDTPQGPMGLGRSARPGTTFEHDPLIIRVLVDEEMKSWVEVYQWMLGLNNYRDNDCIGWKKGGQPEGITLHILDNNRVKPVLSYHMYGAWPSDCSEVEFMHNEEGDLAMTFTLMLQFKYFEVEKDGKIFGNRPLVTEAKESNYLKVTGHPSQR